MKDENNKNCADFSVDEFLQYYCFRSTKTLCNNYKNIDAIAARDIFLYSRGMNLSRFIVSRNSYILSASSTMRLFKNIYKNISHPRIETTATSTGLLLTRRLTFRSWMKRFSTSLFIRPPAMRQLVIYLFSFRNKSSLL